MTEEKWDLPDPSDFDFVEAYDEAPSADDRMLEDNTALSAINCAFIGIGGGGGKLAKAFLDIGFNKTLLINTTEKDQPDGINPENFILIPGADGVGKDVKLGKEILSNNSTLVEDALRTRVGKVDWIFVLAGAGGGTGSASYVLHKAMSRYLSSIGATGKVVYIVSTPTSQELLNPTINTNHKIMLKDISGQTHIIIDNEKQLNLLRGKVGMLNMYPAANLNFAKLFAQVLKLADEPSPIQAFDSKDLKSSPCPPPANQSQTGVLLLIATPDMANDPNVSNKLEAAFSYVGGRAETLFSGVYVRDKLPGLIALTLLGGM